MFSSITSFLWGSRAVPVVESASPQEPIIVPPKNFVEDVPMVDDAINGDSRLSEPRLSDEESDWVFVNKNSDMNGSEKEVETNGIDSALANVNGVLRERRRKDNQKRSNQAPVTRSSTRTIPNSALQAQSVLNALAVIRPQQKAQRRQRELRLKHKQLERSNLASEVDSSSNRPNKRRNRYAPNVCSRVVNNRKC